MKKRILTFSIILSAAIVFSVLGVNFIALAVSDQSQSAVKGNVPVTSEPNSRLVFDADGNYEVILEAVPATISEEVGHEIGENLVDQDPEAFAAANQKILDEMENLPVYPYEQYYIAHEGAVAQYDDQGELIRVRGDYQYYSTLDQYYVNGELPDGRYVGTFLEFGKITDAFETTDTKRNELCIGADTVVYNFSTTVLDNVKQSDVTLTMKELVWQKNATFTISGTCTKPTAKLSFELYRKVDGEWVRVARATNVSCTSNGAFEWSTSYGADGDYGLKAWHNLDADDVVKITGNLIYQDFQDVKSKIHKE